MFLETRKPSGKLVGSDHAVGTNTPSHAQSCEKTETEMNTQLSLEVGVGSGRFSKALGND